MTNAIDNEDRLLEMCDALFERVRTEASRHGVVAALKREDHTVTFRLPDKRVLVVSVEYSDTRGSEQELNYVAAVRERASERQAWHAGSLDEVANRLAAVFKGTDPFRA